jgi:elongation factor Tu
MPDPEMHELVEMEIKELLAKYDYDPDKTVFVRGSALCALNDTNPEIGFEKIKELIRIMDEKIELPVRDIDKHFLMSVESVYNIEGRGAVSTGTVESGKAKVGKEVEVCKGGKKIKTTITGIETFKKTMDYAEAGDNVGILTRGLTKNDLSRGMILADPGVVNFSTCAEANVYFNKTEEGGRKNGFYTGFKP